MIMHILRGDEQYRLHAYVCDNSCVQTVDHMGTVSFTHVFVNRPNECRYAVVSQWNTRTHKDDVMVWDMYESQEKLRTGRLVPPENVKIYRSVDAAITATMLTYGDK